MTLFSVKFFIFLLAIIFLYFTVFRKHQNLALIIFSAFFALSMGGKRTLVFLFFTLITTYGGARFIEKESSLAIRRVVFVLVLIANAGSLFAFKYLNFFFGLGNICFHIARSEHYFEPIHIVAPLGISFYTLQMIGYLADVYMGITPAETKFINYAACASFFPQIMTGPINKYQNMRTQFESSRKFSYKNLTYGCQRIMWGYFKKFVIAERYSVIVNTVFGDFYKYNGAYIPFATFSFAIQLYADFSGSIDMMIGIAEIFGIQFEENFQTPFFSTTISEFWRRWHITLGEWFKTYIFYPMLKTDFFVDLGEKAKARFGKRTGKKVPVILALAILWFLLGFWHGGLWKYIFGSGLIPCFYMVLGMLWGDKAKRIAVRLHINQEAYSYTLFQRIRTFILFCSGMVFFRANSFMDGLRLYKHTFDNNWTLFSMEGLTSLGLDIHDLNIAFYALIVLFIVDKISDKHGSVRDIIAKQGIVFRWIVYIGLLFSVIIFGMYGTAFNAADFIYAGF